MAVKCVLLIPVRSFAHAKTRLVSILNDKEREKAMKAFVGTVISAGQATNDIDRIIIVSDDSTVREFAHEHSVDFFASSESLNRALKECVDTIHDARHIIIAHGDLACVQDFNHVCTRLKAVDIVLAPDRHRSGTNLYGHRTGLNLEYCFGEGSLKKHMHNIQMQRKVYALIQSNELGFDIDTPDDYELYLQYKRA